MLRECHNVISRITVKEMIRREWPLHLGPVSDKTVSHDLAARTLQIPSRFCS
jgi:hypothetical protein